VDREIFKGQIIKP